MPLDTYAGLRTAIAAYVDDATVEPHIADCITQAEARFRRVLVMPEMETQVTLQAAPSVTLPADLDSIRTLTVLGARQATMQPTSPTEFYGLPTAAAGAPSRYTVIGNALLSWPTPDAAYSALLTYYAKLPALSDANPSNWLLRDHPDLYLKAALAEAEFFGWNDERLPGIITWVDGTLAEVQAAGNRKRYGGPLSMRANVRQVRGAPC